MNLLAVKPVVVVEEDRLLKFLVKHGVDHAVRCRVTFAYFFFKKENGVRSVSFREILEKEFCLIKAEGVSNDPRPLIRVDITELGFPDTGSHYFDRGIIEIVDGVVHLKKDQFTKLRKAGR